MLRKATLISNPKTGRYVSRRKTIQELASDLNAQGVEVELKFTAGPGDAADLAAKAANNGSTDVIVAGGDGTINEAIQGMVGTKSRLGILPRGTANVLARELGLPMNIDEAINIAAHGKSRRIHFGIAIDETTNIRRHFVLMAGIGLDASVVRRVQPGLKRRIGKGAFWLSGLSHLATWHPSQFTLDIEGKLYNATFAAIGKAAHYGGDLMITPRARLDEPSFEICIIESVSRVQYLHLLSYAMREGMPNDKQGVYFVKASKVRAFGDAPVQVDGEVIGHLPMRFEISPHSLEVIVP
ncbi:MAG TPA: diacylglycerol kinase family protein [Pyrinomonadaceae bacterium]|jgi:diacylglycerol kinase (ATP)|nr:diacylglycerol kinase family protein [Pyrinomonadaceae bacterium]